MAVIGSLSVKLGLVTVEWDQATAKAKAQAKQLQSSFNDLTGNVKELGNRFRELGGAFGLGLVGVGEMIRSTMEFSNEVNDVAKSFDLTTAKVLQFRDALQTSGGKAENASKALSTLFSKIEDARKGNEATISDFEKLGLSFEDLNRMKPDEALGKVFDGLSKIGNTYERVKATKEMLGKGGIGVAVDEVAGKLGMSTDEYQKNAAAVDHLGEVSDNLKSSMDNLKLAFADLLSPFVGDGLIGIDTFKSILLAIGSYVVATNLVKLVNIIRQIAVASREMAVVSATLVALGGPAGLLTAAAAVASATAIYFTLQKLTDKAQEMNAAPRSQVGSLIDQMRAASGSDDFLSGKKASESTENRPEIRAARAKLKLLEQEIGFSKQLAAIKLAELTTDKFTVSLNEEGVKYAQAMAAAQAQYEQDVSKEKISKEEIAVADKKFSLAKSKAYQDFIAAEKQLIAQQQKDMDIAKQRAAFDKSMLAYDIEAVEYQRDSVLLSQRDVKLHEEIMKSARTIAGYEQDIAAAKQTMHGDELNVEIDRINAQIDAERTLSQVRQDTIVQEDERRTNFSAGWKAAWTGYVQDSQNYGQMAGDIFGSVMGNMGSAIDNFAHTGKFAFKDFARSVIQDILAIVMKMQMMKIIMSAVGSFGGGVAGGGASVDSAAGNLFGSSFSTDLSGLQGKAVGGFVDRPSIVGENGPELFIPRRSGGTIVPNSALNSMGSAPQTVINGPYIANMSAIDTQSAAAFLAKNKQAVFAANFSAQRSLPAGR